MHQRIFKRMKTYEDVYKFLSSMDNISENALIPVRKVLDEESNEEFILFEENDKINYIKFYHMGSCELCFEKYSSEDISKKELWAENPPTFMDKELKLEIIFEVSSKK